VWPDVVVHADWSVDPGKRWACVARRRDDCYAVETIEPVADLAALVGLVAPADVAVIGVDAPIGLPVAYARAAGIPRFLPWLRELSAPALAAWSRVAATPGDIGVARPFYPQRPGGARRAHLVEGLGQSSFDDLLRCCDRSPPLTRPAASLFWTMGANQVGKAALALWADLVGVPAARVWPFDGDLQHLVAGGGLILAEAYPAALGEHLGVTWSRGRSKRRQRDRIDRAPALAGAARRLDVDLVPSVRAGLHEGFGAASTGEDAYDAFVGLLGVVDVLRGSRPAGPPAGALDAATVEGWILGVG
jgi:hypothetical protein